jgi:putative DNA primase/helicase
MTQTDSSLDNFGKFSQVSTTFDIRDYLDKLEPGKGKDFYTCPVCEGRRLGIDPKSPRYQCWSGGCSTNDIREAIRPLAEFLAECKGERPPQIARKPKAKKKEYLPVAIPIGAKLLRLPAPGKPPHAERPKYFPKGVPGSAAQITYSYSDTQKVLRFEWPAPENPKGRDKTYRQTHIDFNGKQVWSKGDARWPAYQIAEVVETLQSVPDGQAFAVLTLEGEPNVELGRSHSIAGLTVQGSNWT